MISNNTLVAAAITLGFGVAQIGCMALSEAGVDATDGVGLETLNGNSGGGTNGADSVDTIENMEHLWNVGNAPFGEANVEVIKIQSASTGTRNLLSYVVACALPIGSYTINGISYTGKALLNSTTSWETAALSTQAKYDLVECIMAHVNPYGQQVDMRLTGQAMMESLTSIQASEFSRPEALWVVYENAVGGLEREVWPFPTPAGECAFSNQDIDARVCGDFAGEARCGVTMRGDMQNHCTQSGTTGNWSCDGRPAIQTWLRPFEVGALYPSCEP